MKVLIYEEPWSYRLLRFAMYTTLVATLTLQFLDQLDQATAQPQNVSFVLAHLDTLDYDSIEVILDNVQVSQLRMLLKYRQLQARSLLPLHYKEDLKGLGMSVESAS